MDIRYQKWFNEIENAARMTIGKTTFKEKNKSAISTELRDIQEEKRKLSDQIQSEKDKAKRETLVTMYKCTQAKALDCMAREKAQEITEKLEKITMDGSQSSLWREKRHMTRDPILRVASY